LARGALALGLGLAAGAVIGRTFPAVLATAFSLVVVFVGLLAGIDAWMSADARPVPQSGEMDVGSKIYNTGLRDDETGEIMTFTEYYAANDVDEMAEMPPPGMTMMAWQIPAADYPIWMAREAAILGGLATVAVSGYVFVVLRRSPS
jgi:hypothetical protein